ncbi:hypothetical protein B0A48_14763 [Cryoendolithus antarcticus]|uniref:Non-classical export protein 1 n=1 Tax=Cryoendolithus antarcticus TaxID=1507870 RepID=A0A1V8SL69_9PEZI|nr:hypothetical protein B0A48_14763 [Cryoendolithus antarcticus]OQO24793.1 hypothetical protein B0A51_09418 [Rachicladosporium sp. CCFEE 5018]
MSAPYLISKSIDPIFAMSVGLAAAYVRINREEKEKGKTTQQSVDSLRLRLPMALDAIKSTKLW